MAIQYNRDMLLRKAYRFKLRVNHPDTAARLHQFSGCTRFVWNKMLAMNLYRLEHKQALLWYPEMAFWLTLWKSSDEYAFLRDCHSQVLQQSMMQLDRAFMDAFDKEQPNKTRNNRINCCRDLKGEAVKTVSVIRKASRLPVSVCIYPRSGLCVFARAGK